MHPHQYGPQHGGPATNTANAPTAEEFLAQHEPDEDEPSLAAQADAMIQGSLGIGPGQLWQIPPDPMERIATALEAIVKQRPITVHEAHDARETAAEIARVTALVEGRNDLQRSVGASVDHAAKMQEKHEIIADLEAERQTLTQVISDVEAALGKSKAAPALAAKAVIEAWKNPQVETSVPEGETEPSSPPEPDLPSLADMDEANESVPGHTRTPHESGPDFCRECSGELQEWITWPCPTVSGEAQPLATGPEEGHEKPVHPAHNAPVEEWREYARALGFAGPDIDKANRSVIRTTLGIAHTQEP